MSDTEPCPLCGGEEPEEPSDYCPRCTPRTPPKLPPKDVVYKALMARSKQLEANDE